MVTITEKNQVVSKIDDIHKDILEHLRELIFKETEDLGNVDIFRDFGVDFVTGNRMERDFLKRTITCTNPINLIEIVKGRPKLLSQPLIQWFLVQLGEI